MKFELPKPFRDRPFIIDLDLCSVVLENEDIPWIMLIPRRPSINQINRLSPSDSILLINEINMMSNIMESIFTPDKLNVAAIGNKTDELHIHIVCRYKNDRFWPETIWGNPLKNLDDQEISRRVSKIREKVFVL